jgi:hypothetical protein
MDKFDRHIAKPKELKIKAMNGEEDVFTIYPLPFMYLADLYSVMRKMGMQEDIMKKLDGADNAEQEKEQIKAFLQVMDEDTFKTIQMLTLESLKISYPDVDVSKLEKFASTNFMEIFPIVMELNQFSATKMDARDLKKAEAMKRMKQ